MLVAEGALRNAGRAREAQAIKKVLRFRLDAASAAYRVNLDLDNIEDLFSLASADPTTDLDNELPLAIAGTIDHFQRSPERPVEVLDDSFHVPRAWSSTGAKNHYKAPLYDVYVGAMLGRFGLAGVRNTIITFNYDTVVEDALGRLGIPYTYGLTRTELELASRPPGCVHPYDPENNALLVLKLHGSMNWAAGGGVEAAGKATLRENYAAVWQDGKTPVLVPPTWKKTFGARLEGVWQRAVESLATATRIVIVGFSAPVTDVHFRFLLGAGLRENITLHNVVMVNPDPDETVEQRIRGLFSPRVSERREIEIIRCETNEFFFTYGPLSAIGRAPDAPCVRW